MSAPFCFLRRAARRVAAFVWRSRPLVVWPAVEQDGELGDMLYKMSFMFPGRRLLYAGLPPEGAARPDYLGDIRLAPAIRRIGRRQLAWRALTGHIVLLRRCRTRRQKLLARLPQVFNVDPLANRDEGWQYFYAYNLAAGHSPETPHPGSGIDFAAYPRRASCYAFGSGASLQAAWQHDFRDGYTVVCNSMIRDLPLMEHIRPDFLVFADAIFHFGPSAYAQAFRRSLRAFSDRFPACRIVVPQNLANHFLAVNPELRVRTCVIPRARGAGLNLDWRRRCEYHRVGNVLNMMIIPLASTLAATTLFLGFDGHAPQSRRFWSYAPGSNFDQLLAVQERAHPAFFAQRDYERHARLFYRQSEEILRAGEAQGNRYASLASSHNPAMESRWLNPAAGRTVRQFIQGD